MVKQHAHPRACTRDPPVVVVVHSAGLARQVTTTRHGCEHQMTTKLLAVVRARACSTVGCRL
eukprot:12250810-Alexandrium_andersonii.AAC.1